MTAHALERDSANGRLRDRKLRQAASGAKPAKCLLENLEPRLLFSESASAQLTLISASGTGPSTVYTYDVTVHDTGTTKIGTFWLSWIPEQDLLPTTPISETSPSGWGPPGINGSGDLSDGTSIQWVANSGSADISAGASLGGFGFSTHDSPSVLAGNSTAHPQTSVLTSFVYAGAPFTDAGFQFNVAPAGTNTPGTTSTALVASVPSINAGDSVTLTATVTPGTPGTTPTGTVTFSSNAVSLGTAAVDANGVATFTTSALTAGSDSLTATYTGDGNYSASNSPTVVETVNPVSTGTATSITTLVASGASVNHGANVGFTAIIGRTSSATPPPTGSVNFFSDGVLLGTVAVGSDGTAPFSTSSLATGVHSITAVYSGDSVYAASTSTPAIETVIAAGAIPTIVKSTLPESIILGLPAHGAINLTLDNQTDAILKGKFIVDIYATSTGVIDSASTLIGALPRNLIIKAGKSAPLSVHFKSIPPNLPAGSYTLLARTYDPASNVTDSTTGPTLQAAAPFLALSEAFTKLTLPASFAAPGKVNAVAALSISNAGNVVTPLKSTVQIYVSTTGQVDNTAIPLTGFARPIRVKPGKSLTVSLPIHKVPTIPAGTYFIVAQVTDAIGQTSSVVSSSTFTVTN